MITRFRVRINFSIIPTPQATSNSLILKFSEAVVEKNENAASNWAGVLICKRTALFVKNKNTKMISIKGNVHA